MLKEDKRYIVAIFKRLRFSDRTSLYVHEKSVIGHFDIATRKFVGEDGMVYDSIENHSNHFSDADYAYSDPEELSNVKLNVYRDTTPDEVIDQEVDEYFNDDDYDANKEKLVETKVRDSEALLYFDRDKSSDCFITHLDKKGELIVHYFFEEDLLHLDELTYNLPIPTPDELKKRIESDDISRKELEEIERLINSLRKNELESLRLATEKIASMDADAAREAELAELSKPIQVDAVYQKVIKTLIGQNRKVRQTIATISHLERINAHVTKKEGFLLTGSTGTGKTLMLELIAKYVNRPLLIVNSTSLTVPGYTGTDIEEVLWRLIESCGGDVKKAERAIVYFDEIDKKGSDNNSDVSGRGVLNILLKFMDGVEFLACKNMQHIDEKTSARISTKNMIVGAGGAFENVYGALKNNRVVGFTQPDAGNAQQNDDCGDETHADQFVNLAGMPSEFMGRFDDEIHLDDLTPELLVRILLESDQSQLLIEQQIFEMDFGVELLPTMDYVRAIAQRAYDKKLGVRGMKSLVKRSIINAYDFCQSNPGVVKKIILHELSAYDNNAFLLLDEYGNTIDHDMNFVDEKGPVLVKLFNNDLSA